MITVPCPEMYCGESVRYVGEQDYQGEGAWGQYVTYWTMADGDCGHEYNIEQGNWMDRLLDEALKTYVPDYPDEP